MKIKLIGNSWTNKGEAVDAEIEMISIKGMIYNIRSGGEQVAGYEIDTLEGSETELCEHISVSDLIGGQAKSITIKAEF